MAARAAFAVKAQRDGCVGESVKSFYAAAGRGAAFEKDRGLALVAAFLFQRMA